MSPKKQTSFTAKPRKTRLRKNTDFYAKSFHSEGNAVLKSANLTATTKIYVQKAYNTHMDSLDIL